MSQANHVLYRPEFPRSDSYDPEWVMDNQMGPNALWLLEWLCASLDLKPDMRVLDLGCGTAMTSVFLAREFNVRVWAADLWVNPDENWKRVCSAGLSDHIFPMRVEAHSLPFAREFFDAVISVDAYHYFGTDELYLGYLSCFVRPHGVIAIAVPGLMQHIEKGVPEHLSRKQSNGHAFWEDECISFHTAQWWRALWERSNRVEVAVADTMPEGWKLWRDFEIVLESAKKNQFPSVAEALDADQGQYVGFVRLVGNRKEGIAPMNLYDPGLIAQMNSDNTDSR
ncbi:MAG: methyltransferase domain-containing protein [Candidatus Abyssobacteria bacterium SURF_17]|uniref:Methyltransferase domain-containing protein n=1 Tax=Candidatus Abyssobacteria bacterium SURF_17 TaxID=2093361 RepID=A0A419EW01_9BACT|nr:MAG: methyltransferase domain-containing protein [Candidatus Abyssubacteria bacterium SURF_17]